jgi:hypothetical protein
VRSLISHLKIVWSAAVLAGNSTIIFFHDFSGDFFYILFHFLVIEICFKKVN